MSPREAADFQVQAYRRMTGEERLAIALRLHDLSCDIAREGIRRQHPGASEAQVDELLRERLELVTRS
jgi:Rv0078B-related antitoxin